jgi:hypothetical protein
MSNNYLRFLALAQAIDLSTEFADVDEAAKQLLIYIALRHSQGKSITVTEAMGLKAIASPATIHRKLDVLLKVGLITKVLKTITEEQNICSQQISLKSTLRNLVN